MSHRVGRRLSLAAFAAVIVSLFALPALAQQRLPPGPWSQVCRNASIDRGVLRADCPAGGNNYRRFEVNTNICPGQPITYADGALRCPGGQTGTRPPGGSGGGNAGWWGQGLPPGSYRQSCTNARIEGRDLLVAQCRRQNGGSRNTRLDIDECRGRDIANVNGHLECGDRRYSGDYGGYKLPPGSWNQSCRNARIVRDDLVAECRARDGDWRRASLDLDECRNRSVSNDNGRLRCGEGQGGRQGGGQGGNYRMPGGSWQASCRNSEIRGDDLYAQCRGRDGRWHNTRLDLDRCPGRPLSNDNGELRCS